jgi:hypothetical protein
MERSSLRPAQWGTYATELTTPSHRTPRDQRGQVLELRERVLSAAMSEREP